MDLWVALWLASVGIVVGTPIIAWHGRPRGFRRIHWLGVLAGTGFAAFLLLYSCEVALLSLKPKWFTLLLLSSAQILMAGGIGSLLAVFFCRPGRE
jgi:hypothetical protein